jgi:hypothetical protein
MYNNKLACKKYYDKNKHNPEFRMRKAMTTRRQYYKNNYPMFWNIFQAWKSLLVKNTKLVYIKRVKTSTNRKLNSFIIKRNRLLLKIMIDSWKDYERSPVKINPNCKPIVCSFF